MNYFKVLSIVLGGGLALGGVGAVFFREGLTRLLLRLYPELRPGWIKTVGALVLLLVLWTWVEFVRAVTMENFVVTLVMSLGFAKIVPLVFYYKKTREILLALVTEPLAFRVVLLSSAAVGLALVMMGLFF